MIEEDQLRKLIQEEFEQKGGDLKDLEHHLPPMEVMWQHVSQEASHGWRNWLVLANYPTHWKIYATMAGISATMLLYYTTLLLKPAETLSIPTMTALML